VLRVVGPLGEESTRRDQKAADGVVGALIFLVKHLHGDGSINIADLLKINCSLLAGRDPKRMRKRTCKREAGNKCAVYVRAHA
jgi:hypothetical protein